MALRDDLWRRLRHWYHRVKRTLPWREGVDPYAVLVSEVMLQQTQVATAIPYFQRFTARFPTVEALAHAPIEDVLHEWQGLGYYSRARNLHRAAKEIVDRFDGKVPSDASALLTLPGVGRYTAGAVASIAFNEPVPILDGNVMRVLTRIFAITGNPKAGTTNRQLWHIAEALLPRGNASTFNVAMMELGALVCTPTKPNCAECPVANVCKARAANDVLRYPELPPRPSMVSEEHVAVRVGRDGAFLLTQRRRGGKWAGLWELPRVTRLDGEGIHEAAERAALQVCGVRATIGSHFGDIRHTVTHHRIRLHGFDATWLSGEPEPIDCEAVEWVKPDVLDTFALPSPQRRLLDLAGHHLQQHRLF